MKVSCCSLAAIALVFDVSAASAQPRTPLSGCPDLTSLRASAMRTTLRSANAIASDALIARGRAATRTFSGDNVAKAISLFEQAVRADPTNTSAYFSLARAHTQSQRYMSVPKKIAVERARENLAKGRALSPASIEGLQLLADLTLRDHHDYACAKSILETALRLDPKNALSNHYYSQLLSGMGEFDRAFQYADTALAYATADTRATVLNNLGRPHYMAGHYDWVLTKYYDSDPNAALAHFYRSLAYGGTGLFAKALDEAKAYRESDRARDAGGIGMIALAYANAGQHDTARVVLSELLQRDARGEHVVEYRIAAVYAALGERDEAFRWLDKEIVDTDGLGSWLVWLNYDPVWKDLRKDARWKGLQTRAGW